MLKSLHAQLLAWLIVPLLFLSGAHMVSTYTDTRTTSTAIFDKLLVTLALSISEHALNSGGDLLTDDLLELIRVTTNDSLYYKVIGPDASFIMGYEDIPEPAGGIQVLEGNVQFYDSEYLDQSVRVIAVSTLVDRRDFSGWMTTFVAQTLNDRAAFVQSILQDNALRVLVLIAVASLLMSIGIALGLRPLKRLQASISRRDRHDLSAIDPATLPTEIGGLAAALNGLLHRLQQHVSLTRRFVENASHQLRTPVAALLPQSELALRHAESDRERTAVGRIQRSARQIARLTHQLLNLTYAESIALSREAHQAIDLARVAQEHVEQFAEVHPAFAVHAELAPVWILGEEMLLGEVLDNLLDNAHKYGAAEVWVTTSRSGAEALLAVADDGPGFPPAALEKVTERFYRADGNTTGAGLGLAIASEIVSGFGGELDVGQRANGSGAQVLCRFPRAPDVP